MKWSLKMKCCDVRTNSLKQYHKECMKNMQCGEDAYWCWGFIFNHLKLCIAFIKFYHEGSVILLENLRFHIEEEGKGVDSEGKKVLNSVQMKAMHSEVLL